MEINGKKVIDAKKPLRISISESDARLGKTRDPGACAAARAIIRTIADVKAARVYLDRTYVEHPTHWTRYRTPASLKLEIVSFDRGAKAEYSAGDYTLDAPSLSNKLGSRKGKKPGTGTKKRRPHIARIRHQIEVVLIHGANR